MLEASMRPRHYAAEYRAARPQHEPGSVASMRPRHYAAEYLGVVPAVAGAVIALQ